ncbi:cbb3-type cytochrome c oxidase subunit I [Candidatus Magnetomonas plexicatena]|uniref:cbb3-type cytochrome c oxidase subunit I n=1 Tax=Candidatus Magnetomonas plexicatena TaxID=2552947 RepID=UPI001104C84B|nr:hypothetical protein E2O03_006605 [Nitrospirales bacterium LBB_01]
MDKFVRNFIVMSIVYLCASSFMGVFMLIGPKFHSFKFAHSHFMVLGWVSMMIYGVGYHILPRFSGRPLKSVKIGEVQFWLANIGLIGMAVFYSPCQYVSSWQWFLGLAPVFGFIEFISIALFFYNMLATLLAKVPGQP